MGAESAETRTVGTMGDAELPFRPGTVSWGVLRRPVFLLGGMNALLLQLAEPRVAAGIVEHSDFANRIFDRLRHTVDVMVEIGLGDPSDADRALGEMARAHRGVEGTMPDGSTYHAGDPELRLWVMATLIATVLEVEARYVGEFDESDRSRYYEESLEVANVLGVGQPPPDLSAFRRYMSRRVDALEVTADARHVARHVLHPRIGVPPALFAPLRLVTIDLLPPRLRAGYRLLLSPGRNRWIRRMQSMSRKTTWAT